MTKILRLFVPVLFALLSALSTFGQTGTITGVVRDRETRETLPGANVIIEGTTTGAITDLDGRYAITVGAGQYSVVASYIGFEPVALPVTVVTGQTVTLNFDMGQDVATLSEFVIIGYGVQRREDATGAVSVVDTRDFNKGKITSPSELLAGKIPGVQITMPGGAPGEGAQIRVRGGSSLSATNDPLIVIDGVPIENAGVPGLRNPLATINPDDIESFTVLKDASATAIYGSRASNGVILITTKKGKEGAPLSLTYSGTYSLSVNTRQADFLSPDEFRNHVNTFYANRPTVTGLMGSASTDWPSLIYQDAFTHDHNLTASGAFKSLPYRFTVGYNGQDGVIRTDNLQRVSWAMNLSPSLFDDHLKINFNARAVNISNFFAEQGVIGAANQFDPTQPVHVDGSPFGGFFAWQADGIPKPVATTNPVANLELRRNTSTVNRILGNFQADYKFHFLPDLRANLNVAYDYSTSDGNDYTPDYAAWSYVSGGYLGTYWQNRSNQLFDFYLNYVKDVEAISSRIDATAGYSYQRFWNEGSNHGTNVPNNLAFQNGHNTDYWRVIVPNIPYESEQVLLSFFGRLNYSLLNRYLVTFTMRNDRSSRFSPETRSGWFPSVALAWKVLEEPFMANADFLSELKFRAGYGITGQQDISSDVYPYLARYTASVQGAFYQFGAPGNFIPTWRAEGYDRSLKWEETTTYNAGLDYAFQGHRYYGSIDVYFRETRDLINEINIPAGTNLTNRIVTNIGNMENKGVEFSIFTRPVVSRDFNWLLGLNATWNETKITKLTAVDDPEFLGIQVGGIAGGVGNNVQIHTVGYAPNSFFVWEQVYDQDGNPIEGVYVDRDNDGEITEDDLYRYKRAAPTYYLGLTSDFQYKNWSLAFAGRANLGNFVYNNISSDNGWLNKVYRAEGPYLSNIHRDAFTVGFNNAQYLSDYYVQDGSFFKMDHITLSYTFGKLFGSASNLTLSGIVQNAFMITNYKGLDPELGNGIDNNIYPRPRIFVMSVNLQF
ncbi:MAG: SusC/RagA family TonB-linked outer membrane protein [Bacteroidales bacterium]|jgi:iron complex outermembrane receptor protein|nr:SusC/RagA family TonB-linked outer membrane protein [Bacteroidales bacterium]NLM93477.1 SusC/RagA family TonB-linked outer membrane protein [Bacteroidales bacterium]